MPVLFRPDELRDCSQEPDTQVVWDSQAGTRLTGLIRAFCGGLWVSAPGAVGLWFGLRLMKPALKAAAVLSGEADYWRKTWIPMLLFCLYGLILGGAIAWRVTSAASLGGAATWLVGGAHVLLVVLTGILVSTSGLFAGNVPSTCWIGIGLLAGSAVAGIYLLGLWND